MGRGGEGRDGKEGQCSDTTRIARLYSSDPIPVTTYMHVLIISLMQCLMH